MARALEWAITRPASVEDRFLAVNVGAEAWNVLIAALAEAVRAEIPGTAVEINRRAQPDQRSYRVDFSRHRALAPNHQPLVGLEPAVRERQAGRLAIGLRGGDSRRSPFTPPNVPQPAVQP